jgi:6,7-dimethyl-8-ribityllumazine synthase
MAGIRSTTPPSGAGRRFALVVARFHAPITERLRQGAVETFAAAGVAAQDLETFPVPGAFELPLACRIAAASGRFAAVVAIGAVIRGGTDHYEHICAQTARGVMEAGLTTGVPVLFCVLTCENEAQALARAGGAGGADAADGAEGNKGAEAAQAALEIAETVARLRSG